MQRPAGLFCLEAFAVGLKLPSSLFSSQCLSSSLDFMADDVPLLAMSAQDTLQQNPRTDRIKDNLESGLGGLHGNVETYTKNKGIFSNAPFQGWKFSAFVAFVTSVIVLCFNVGFLLYSTTHHQDEVLYEGNCDKVHRLSVVFHLLINALSTALLGASNFGMVCMPQTSHHQRVPDKST